MLPYEICVPGMDCENIYPAMFDKTVRMFRFLICVLNQVNLLHYDKANHLLHETNVRDYETVVYFLQKEYRKVH